MVKRIDKNVNSSDTSTASTISVDSTTATTLLPALVPGTDQVYIEVAVTNNGNKALWVRRRPAAADNFKTGVRLAPGESRLIEQDGDMYTGEISAIFESGGARDVIVEFI